MPRDPVSTMLRQGLYTRVIGRRILYFPSLSSTMDEAARLAGEGAEDGTVVLAEQQTGGRGRFQRRWVSPPGNLYLSLVLHPSLEGLQYVGIISSVAVVRAIRKTTGLSPTIKWPNDVRLAGKKVCGILVENALQGDAVVHSIVGIGLNIELDSAALKELGGIATSLGAELGRPVDRQTVLRQLLQEMDRLYLPLRPRTEGRRPVSGGPEEIEKARDQWRTYLETLGTHVEVRWLDEVYNGYAEDVDELGNLILRIEDGSLVTLPAGEVTSRVTHD